METKQSETTAPHVYAAIVEIGKRLAQQGIAKLQENTQQGYKFRGIDDIQNALAPLLAEIELCILPEVISREVAERTTKTGGAIFTATVHVEYTFVSAKDGSKHTVSVYGEAMDTGDKATNKAMSAAYKYMAIQTFCIPTEGDNDADATTHDVAAENGKKNGNDKQEAGKKPGVENVGGFDIGIDNEPPQDPRQLMSDILAAVGVRRDAIVAYLNGWFDLKKPPSQAAYVPALEALKTFAVRRGADAAKAALTSSAEHLGRELRQS